MDKHNKPQVIIDLDEYNELLKRPPVTGNVDFSAVISAIGYVLLSSFNERSSPEELHIFREISKRLEATGVIFSLDASRYVGGTNLEPKDVRWQINPRKFPIKQ